jgi:hypothetical protein
MLGNYRVAAQLVTSRVVLSSTELFSYKIFTEPHTWKHSLDKETIKYSLLVHKRIISVVKWLSFLVIGCHTENLEVAGAMPKVARADIYKLTVGKFP